MNSRISVVIPYMGNRRRNIEATLEGMKKQTFEASEIIVAYYGEPIDEGVAYVHSGLGQYDLPLTVKQCGTPTEFSRTVALNAGFAYVAGTELTAILDADCLLPPPALADAVKLIESGVGLVGAPFFNMMEDGHSERFAYNGRMITGGFMVFRTEDYRDIGGMNPYMKGWGYEDRDFTERLVNHRVRRDGKPGMAAAYLPYPYFHQWHKPVGLPEDLRKQEQENIQVARTSGWTGKEWVRI